MLFQEVLFSWRIFFVVGLMWPDPRHLPLGLTARPVLAGKKKRLIRGGFPQAQLVAGLLSSQGASTYTECITSGWADLIGTD